MKIVLDCDEVILESTVAFKAAYLDMVDPTANIPDRTYSSLWPVWNEKKPSKEEWGQLLEQYRNSKWFTAAPPVSGAAEAIRKLKEDGHTLYVLTAIGGNDEPKTLARRKAQLESLVGENIFEDIIHVERFESKSDKLRDIGAEILVDDSAGNTTDAIRLGIHGIWFMCPENAHIYESVMSGNNDTLGNFWKFDAELLRGKALVANGWDDVLEIIQKLG